jgi:hypothetical protein
LTRDRRSDTAKVRFDSTDVCDAHAHRKRLSALAGSITRRDLLEMRECCLATRHLNARAVIVLGVVVLEGRILICVIGPEGAAR